MRGVLTPVRGMVDEVAEGFGAGGPAVYPLAQRVGLAGRDSGGLGHLARARNGGGT